MCEALYLAGIAPMRPAGQVSLARLERLVAAVRTVLEAAIEAGGSSLRDYARPDGELGYFSKQWRVYGREGEPCDVRWKGGSGMPKEGDPPSGARNASVERLTDSLFVGKRPAFRGCGLCRPRPFFISDQRASWRTRHRRKSEFGATHVALK